MVESFLKEEGLVREKILQFTRLLKRKENKILTMKSKILALSKNEEFKDLLKKKKKSNKYVTIFFGQLDKKNQKKLNISFVTKKKLGNAVKRNKIKRRLRNIMNEAIKSININLNYCYLLIARISVSKDPYDKIKIATLEDFKKIK